MPATLLSAIRAVATDVDGTLTSAGRLDPTALATISALAASGVQVVLVTGRAAGWAAALAYYLPDVAGVVAENGAVVVPSRRPEQPPRLLEGDGFAGVAPADACVADLTGRYPSVRPGRDNFARLSDRTIEVQPHLSDAEVAAVADTHGCRHTVSSVHHHFTTSRLTKRSGLLAALGSLGLGQLDPATNVATIGDSVNDGPLFDHASFALTVGVRGVTRYLEALGGIAPQYVTEGDEAAGFVELGRCLLAVRR